jgi:hypothetical protein
MYIDDVFHDADALHFVGAAGHHERLLSSATGGGLLFPTPETMGEPWLEMAHKAREGWQGATPSLSIALLDSALVRQCTPQGYLAPTVDPNNDNVGAWVNWDQAQATWQPGDSLVYSHEFVARSAQMQAVSHGFEAGLRMIGFPYQRPPAGDVWTADAPDLLRWDGQTGRYVPLPDGEPPAIGQGYWGVFGSAAEVEWWGAPAPTAFRAPVADGWSIVSPPYDTEMTLAAITQAATLRPLAWTDQGAGYELVADLNNSLNEVQDTLRPWLGYWVLSDGVGWIDWDPVEAKTSSADGPPRPVLGSLDAEHGGWQLQICAGAAGRTDAFNFIGLAASSTVQRLALPNAPITGTSVDLYFPRDSGPMASDVRELPCDNMRWEFDVSCGIDGPVRVWFPDLSPLPADAVAVLRDPAGGKSINTRTTQFYEYMSTGPRSFLLEISPRSSQVTLIQSVSTSRGADGVCISYGLSGEAHVTIDILTVAGRLIRRLHDGMLTGGPKTVLWDMHGSTDTVVPAGTYLCRITAVSPDGGRNSAVRPLSITR